ncbi:hypothetical protein Tco_0322406 [Tanacetum coccineum]
MRMAQESGAGDEDYVQRAMIHYEIDTGVAFKLRSGGSKRHKSSGSSSFNIESGEQSINLNTIVTTPMKRKCRKFDQRAGTKQKLLRGKRKDENQHPHNKRRESECREREIEQQDMRFHLQPYDHLIGDQRKAMDEIRAKIKAKYNLQY